jgi:copper(I)-binding protein
MRFLSKLTLMAIMIIVAPAVFAQGGGTSTITVEQPWARATPTGAMTGAVYMTLANKTDTADRLTAASSEVARNVQIHEMTVVNGIMRMRQLTKGLAIPAGGSVTLKPGSYHMMLIGLKKPLIAGQALPLTLTFAKAGNISITVPIQTILGAWACESSCFANNPTPDLQAGLGELEIKAETIRIVAGRCQLQRRKLAPAKSQQRAAHDNQPRAAAGRWQREAAGASVADLGHPGVRDGVVDTSWPI